MADEIYDVVIIGGGPAGLSCALYTARGKLSTVVLDKSPGAGALAYASKIANYPGIQGEIPGSELLDVIREQAVGFGANYVKTTVAGVDLESDTKVVYANDGVFSARSVVISTGARGRASRVEGEDQFVGMGVSYCVTCDAAFYKDRTAAIVGYDEFALEEALFLARFAENVQIINPKSSFNASVDMLNDIDNTPNIVTSIGLSVTKVVGEQFVTGIEVEDREGNSSLIPLDGVFMLLGGSSPITDFLAGAVKTCEGGCIDVDCDYATNIPGVYAVGDVTCLHPNQAIIAAGGGVVAALAIDRYLSGRKRAKVDYM